MSDENVLGTDENGNGNSQTTGFDASAYENDPKFQEYINSQREQTRTETEKGFDGLKSNYDRAMSQLKNHKEKSRAYDGIMEQNQDDEDAKALASGQITLREYKDKLRGEARNTFQKDLDVVNTELDAIKKSVAEKDSLIKQKEISHRVSTAALQDKFFQKDALRDLEMIAERTSELDEAGNLVFRGDDGNILYGTDGKPLDAKGFVDLQKEQRSYMFAQLSGTGSTGSNSSSAAQVISRSEWNKKLGSANAADRQSMIKQKTDGLIKIAD